MKKLVLMLLFVATYVNGFAQTPKVVVSDKTGWHKIGETIVNFEKESDKVMIIGANRFAAIKIKVKGAPIHLESFIIYYGKNESKTVQIGKEFKNQGETSIVHLGGEKNIKRVDFFYHTAGKHANQRARLEIWGLKTNPNKK